MRRIWISLAITFALLVATVVGVNLWVHAYLRSEPFRQLVAAKSGEALRADADLQPLTWSGSSVFSAALTARGADGAPLASLDAQQVRANVDWKAVFDGAWRVTRIDVARLDVAVRTGGEQAASAAAADADPGPTPDALPPRRGFLPQRFQLDEVVVQDANVEVGGVARLRGVGLAAKPEWKDWVIDGSGGKLELPGREPLAVEGFRLRAQPGVIFLTEAALRVGTNGRVTASGEIGGARAPFDLRFQWRDVDTADVLDATWRRRLAGRLSGEARSEGRAGGAPLTTGKFRLEEGRLEGLPVQREIARFTRSPQFERVPLSEVSGDFTTDGAATTVKNFILESPGLLRIEGECRVGADGALAGRFRLGVTSQSLQWLPGSQEKVFRTAAGGYLWTDLTLGGTLEEPTEDLSGRLAQAVGEQVIETGLDLLEGAPENATDAVNQVLDILSPMVP